VHALCSPAIRFNRRSAMPETKPVKSFVSAQQVAERAGVSRSAVSRTFTAGASVSEATRRKVLAAAETLGYHVNHLARGLIHDRSGIVCLIGVDLQSPYQAKILEALTRRLQDIDKVAMVINTAGETGSVEAALRQTLNYRADATIVLSGSPAASLIETCIANGQHVILINRDDQHTGPEHIIVDNAAAAREAFAMLQRAGCRHIAVVSSQAGTSSLVGREQAFAAAAAEAGVEISVVRAGPTAYASGAEAARAVLSRAERPDAAFCVTDLLACGFMDAARYEFGLSIPADLCVIGFDDIDQAGWASYGLTTFRQPIENIAEYVAGLLAGDAAVPAAPEPRYFQADPIWRRSVRPK
jgi:DNA-binding LacI/PurR family transcriptional regulator